MRKITDDPEFEKFKKWLEEHERTSIPSAGQIAKELGMYTSQVARWIHAAGYEWDSGRFVKAERKTI